MSDQPTSQLLSLVSEIQNTFNSRFFYAAISLCLTVPDICSAAELAADDENFWRNQKRYESWCERYLADRISELTPGDIWALRGGVIHRGQTFGHPKSRYSRVVFILPFVNANISGNISEYPEGTLPILDIDARGFCQSVIDAAGAWLTDNKENALVQSNLDGLMRVRPDGFAPHIGTMPVIA